MKQQFPNLRAEMARIGITPKDIAQCLSMPYDAVKNKLYGKSAFRINECQRIRDVYFPEMTLDELFKSDRAS